jgi:hypothetical protein
VASVSIIRVNPATYADAIKELFLAHERPEFPAYFDRAYHDGENGPTSWIALDDQERVVMHIARFPRLFTFGQRTLVGGLLANLMVAKSHRTGLPALRLIRTATSDSATDAHIDFLYGDPNARASGLLRSAGFSTVGMLQRFVFPLAASRWYVDALARVYQVLCRLRARSRGVELSEASATEFDPDEFTGRLEQGPAFRPVRPTALYRQRLAGYPAARDVWFIAHTRSQAARLAATLFVRGDLQRSAQLLSLARDPSVRLGTILPNVVDALRRQGYHRLWLLTLAGTHLAREITRAGFIPRRDGQGDGGIPVMARALTVAGTEAVRAASIWEITDLDCDR